MYPRPDKETMASLSDDFRPNYIKQEFTMKEMLRFCADELGMEDFELRSRHGTLSSYDLACFMSEIIGGDYG